MALNDVDFDVVQGEIHSLIGQNGAGKSTLMKILAGNYGCDEGTIEIDGKLVKISSAADAQILNIAIVYQELSLLPNLTIAENIFLGKEKSRAFILKDKECIQESIGILKDLGIDNLDVNLKVENLPLAKQQIVEIAKALYQKPRILILDEPTAALTNEDTEKLFAILKKLTLKGMAIIFITHRMKEIKKYCDRGTVLMNGKVVASFDISTCSEDDIINSMIGGKIEHFYRTDNQKHATTDVLPALEIRGLEVANKVNAVSCKFYAGEITGITGLLGAGQNEIARAIFGTQEDIVSVQILVNGASKKITSPIAAINCGIGLLTENRKEEGLFQEMSVAENIAIASLERARPWRLLPFISPQKVAAISQEYAKKTNIVMRSIQSQIRNLSGGNQQKAIIARWLLRNLQVLVFIEPTRGIDVGAKAEIYKHLEVLANAGKCIIVVSNDTTEILGISDRILVMYKGDLVGELDRGQSEEALLSAVQGRGVRFE